MRENRPYGSEGGEGQTLPDPYHHEAGRSKAEIATAAVKRVDRAAQ